MRSFTSIAITVILIIISLSGCNSSRKESVNMSVLKQKTTTQYYDDNSKDTNVSTYFYDAKGNLISESYRSYGDKLVDREFTKTYSYDDHGNIISEECDGNGDYTYYSYNDADQLTQKTDISCFGTKTYVYTYDSAGKLHTETEIYSKEHCADNAGSGMEDGDQSTTTYTYDKDAHIVNESTTYIGIDGLTYNYNTTYVYGSNSDLLSEKKYTYHGKVSFSQTTTYDYNKFGDILTETCIDHNGNTISKNHSYTYDSDGNMLEDKCIVSGGFSVTYGHRDLYSSYQYIDSEPQHAVTQWTYDTHGNILTYINTNQLGKHIKTSAYDANNNVVSEEEGYYDLNGRLTQGKKVQTYEYTDMTIEK